jgi:methionyl-tRNA synthetase
MREMPTGGDASYTPERFLTRYDELSNVLGNLASRATSMIVKYRDGVVPDAAGSGLAGAIGETLETARDSMARWRIHEALGAAMDLARTANGYVEERQPWAQAKDPAGADALDETLATLARALCVLCALFQPVTPSKMHELAARLGLEEVPRLDESTRITLAGRRVSKGDPLFPRVEPSWAEGAEG